MSAGAAHATTSYLGAKVLNQEHSVASHTLAGAVAGAVIRFKGMLIIYRMHNSNNRNDLIVTLGHKSNEKHILDNSIKLQIYLNLSLMYYS